jgi:DNA-binding Lrp family transcriptional regulator
VSSKRNRHDAVPHGHSIAASGVLKLVDDLNIKIVKELVRQPNISSTDIATKYRVPLSTVQRRRAKLERKILKKEYRIDVEQLGWRKADLLIAVDKGNCDRVAQDILSSHGDYIATVSLRIGSPKINLMEQIRTIPSVKSVEWSEMVDLPLAGKGDGGDAEGVMAALLYD